MRVRNVLCAVGICAGAVTLALAGAAAAPAQAARIHGNLAQVMRGILFPASNVIFASQSKSQDAILDAADVMATSCANCHDTYREVPGGVANRC
jgi:cytochrome c553